MAPGSRGRHAKNHPCRDGGEDRSVRPPWMAHTSRAGRQPQFGHGVNGRGSTPPVRAGSAASGFEVRCRAARRGPHGAAAPTLEGLSFWPRSHIFGGQRGFSLSDALRELFRLLGKFQLERAMPGPSDENPRVEWREVALPTGRRPQRSPARPQAGLVGSALITPLVNQLDPPYRRQQTI